MPDILAYFWEQLAFHQSAQQTLEEIFGVPVVQVQFTNQGIVINK